jgi:hypothetical protein
VIRAVAFCPHPPLLVPEVAQGAAPELADLRAACRTAIRRVALPGRAILVLGAGRLAAAHPANARGSLAGYGVALEVSLGSDEPGTVELPLSLTIGAWLLRDALGPDCGAVGYAVVAGAAPDPALLAAADDPTGEHVLIAMGDGSARRSISAPGYLDERAEVFDDGVAAALQTGDGSLLHVDLDLAEELLVAGAPVWDQVASLTDGAPFASAELLYAAAPYGVGYFVATWADDE